ncbi:MAG: glucose 1-dehydrogenase [Hyphomicrobiaceae bacterium]|nr:glucose 1-dehydrogenase [Hyphomicrobiaceae bacterium]
MQSQSENPSFSLSGRTALVTGASSGLGRHFAHVLSRAGAGVIVGARRLDRLEDVVRDITSAGGKAHAVAMDVTDAASVTAAFDAGEAALGPIDILVNNAGIPSSSYFVRMQESEWRGVLDVNLDGVFRVGQEAAKRMTSRGHGGSIINIASILGLGVLKTLAPYAVSKAGVIQLTKVMALELARDRIRVNAIAPGYVETEINDAFLESDAGKRLVAKVPMTRAGRLKELDGPLLLLASDAGSYMTGSVVTVDGGTLLSMG